jgi:adenosylhomocysteine nucleosidase
MRIGILVAMEKELMQLIKLLGGEQELTLDGRKYYKGVVGSNEIIIQQCGIGKVNSTIGAVEIIKGFHPELIVSTGVAGGSDRRLSVGDVVVSTSCSYHDAYCGSECVYGQILGMPELYVSPSKFVKVAASLNCGTKIVEGLIVSGEWFVDTRKKMQEILNYQPDAEAVDMESCSIAQTCYVYKVPFISFRIISDIPLKDDNVVQYNDFWTYLANGSFNVTKSFLEKL